MVLGCGEVLEEFDADDAGGGDAVEGELCKN